MRIASLTLTNFKRFTELTIRDVPASAKLVLLIGGNGAGKSSVFDGFNFLHRRSGRMPNNANYYQTLTLSARLWPKSGGVAKQFGEVGEEGARGFSALGGSSRQA